MRSPAEPDDQALTAEPRPARGSVLDLHLGDHLELRKPHPCGSRTWTLNRLGADIGLVCTGCGRRVLLERPQLERRLISIEPASSLTGAADEAAADGEASA